MKGFFFKNSTLFYILFFFISLSLNFPCESFGWELAKEDEGIRVYTRSVEGSEFKAYMAVMHVNTQTTKLVSLVTNVKAYPSWIDTCKEGRVLKRINESECYVYTINGAPWPVSDRDAVVLNTIIKNNTNGTVTIKIEGKSAYIPEKSSLVRVKKICGFWQFRPLDSSNVEVIYQVHSEPGGNIPSWLINSIVVTQPFNTMRKMKKALKMSK